MCIIKALPLSLIESPGVVDRIKGYSISIIFNHMHSGTSSAADLISNLKNSLPVGNTLNYYDSLSNSYGY